MQLILWALTVVFALIGTFIPRGLINSHYFFETPNKVEIAKEQALARAKGVMLTYGK